MKTSLALVLAATLAVAPAHAQRRNAKSGKKGKSNKAIKAITKDMVLTAQKAWGDGIVKIAASHTAGEDYTAVATEHIDTLYAYGKTDVLFKPTLAAEQQFRPTFEDALSYFVATGHIAEDSGFAIKGWTAVRFENDGGILLDGDAGQAMGNYFFTKPDGSEAKVEYSFGYFLDGEGKVRINLHHSSLPYDPAPPAPAPVPAPATLTEAMILDAQQAWGDGIVKIAASHTAGEDYTAVAKDHIDALYAYATPPRTSWPRATLRRTAASPSRAGRPCGSRTTAGSSSPATSGCPWATTSSPRRRARRSRWSTPSGTPWTTRARSGSTSITPPSPTTPRAERRQHRHARGRTNKITHVDD